MAKFAPIHWKKFEKFLFYEGCIFEREHGDHRVYSRRGLLRSLIIPRNNALPLFIIRNNLRILGMSIETYLEILEKL